MSPRVEPAASLLCQARLGRDRFAGFPAQIAPRDEPEAYAVQAALHQCLSGAGLGAVVGHKIGCTTQVMQKFLGIPNPCAGGIFETTLRQASGRFDHHHFRRVGVECEIAVWMAKDLASPRFDRDTVAAAVGGCMAAIEVVEDRYVNYSALDTPTLIADDFFGAGCVLGSIDTSFAPADLSGVTATMRINGIQVGSGMGSDVLGHPLDALVWLAASLSERGAPLRSGEFVLLGSLVQTHWLEAGDEVVIVNDPLGEVRLSLV